MNKETIHIAFLIAILSCAQFAEAQPKKIPRIGWLSIGHGPKVSPPFKQAMRQLGWFHGQNIEVVARFAKEKRDEIPKLAAELVHLNVDVIVAADSSVIRAAKNATDTIPIVMTVVSDPVSLGYVASLARPGGNVTGLSNKMNELNGKRLQILKEAVPSVSHVAMLGPSRYKGWKKVKGVSRSLGVQMQMLAADNPDELEQSFQRLLRERLNGLVVIPSPATNSQRSQIIKFASHNRLPAIYPLTIYVFDGGLISYGPRMDAMLRRAAYYVDRILKGAKPSDLPVEQPMTAELAINVKTATASGIKIMPEVLQQADIVIK